MSEKCNKYESLFVFGTDEQLEEHLKICPECREQHEKMNKTASVVKEVSTYYENYKKPVSYHILLRSAAGLIIIALTYFMVNYSILENNVNGYNLSNNESESVIAEMGLPTDDYGLLMVY